MPPNITGQELEQIGDGIQYIHNVYSVFMARIQDLEDQRKELIEQARKAKDAASLKQVRKNLA